MTHIVEPNVIKYSCTCGLLKPISHLYFCRYCLEVRCGFCVCHEVDCIYCEKCLDNMPSAEAKLKKNRCTNCLVCPSCTSHLSMRAATIGSKNPDDPKSDPQKVVYLHCFRCRWGSRDVGIPDQPAGTGGWPERENVHKLRLIELITFDKRLMLEEKLQKQEKGKKKPKKTYTTFTDKTGITAAMLRKRLGIPDPNPQKTVESIEATAKEVIEEYPEDLFTQDIKLNEITNIEQRLLQPEVQPETVDKLFPVHKHVTCKRSMRCRMCEHNVIKPEFSPNSIRFKIQLLAYYHIPEIRIVTVKPLRAGKPSELFLKFINPTQHQTTINILPITTELNQHKRVDLSENKESGEPTSLTNVAHKSFTAITPREITENIGADFEMSSNTFVLPPRDDAAEFDDSGENYNFQDDTKLVVQRKSNKAVIKLRVTPKELNLGDDVVIGFVMQHLYTNTIAAKVEKDKEPPKCEHRIKVYLNLGVLVGSD